MKTITDLKTIVKRDGRIVDFDKSKITEAIKKAFVEVYGNSDESALNERALEVTNETIEALLSNDSIENYTVEDIQDVVESSLIKMNFTYVAKAYILYRDNRTKVRNMNSKLMQTFSEITFVDVKDSDMQRDNANINGEVPMGAMLKFGSEGSKQFYMDFMMKPEHAKAHKEGYIHVHDMDFAPMRTTTCCQIELRKLFKDGFHTGHGFLREPNSISSYGALAAIAIQSNQNNQHGGQSVIDFGLTMGDGVYKSFKTNYRKNLTKALKLKNPKFADKCRDIAIGLVNTADISMSNAKDYDNIINNLNEIAMSVLGAGNTFTADKSDLEFAYKEGYADTDRETYQSMEAFVHNLNTMHSRAGAQVPFSSINYGLETTEEARMAIKNLLLTSEAGLGNGETSIFPIQIFRVKAGVSLNPGDPNYDLFQLAMRCSAKRLFPNFSFMDAPFNAQYYIEGHPETEVGYMGCRTRVIGNVYDTNRQISPGRGNLSFTSINLPRLAIEAKHDVDLFYTYLDHYIDICIDQLLDRFEQQKHGRVRNFPFLMGQGCWIDSDKLDWDDEVGEVLKHGTLSVGFIGLAECLKALIGKHHGESEEAQKLGLEIITHMRKRMDDESQKRQLNFTLLATPSENLCGRVLRLDRKKYGVIEGVTDKEWYTNSNHVPVEYPISAFEKIKIEAPYHALTNAGHICYVEVDGDPVQNLEAFEKVIHFMSDSGVGYGSINHPVDRDPVCGFTGIIYDECPCCGRREDDGKGNFERIRRITGYLVGTLDRWNNAKQAEEKARVKHTGKNGSVG